MLDHTLIINGGSSNLRYLQRSILSAILASKSADITDINERKRKLLCLEKPQRNQSIKPMSLAVGRSCITMSDSTSFAILA